MSQMFYKGRTNNHLTWVMVDATDFATPESALSAATKIKIYGKLRGAAGVNFVSSGTGSLTNDITHVGASALGLYSIGLAKADLSDASAAWYDQYIVSLSATGAAYQTIIVEGGIDASTILAMSAMLSDAHSAAILAASHASDAHSAAVVAQGLSASDLSDLRSAIAAGPAATVTASDISDIASAVWAHAVGTRVDSRVLVIQSLASDAHSAAVVAQGLSASDLSDLRSAISAGPAATVTASDISDIASAVWAHAVGTRVDSRVLVIQSMASDVYSLASNINSATLAAPDTSDFASAVLAEFSDALSDLRSQIGAVTATLSASDLSDLRSAITAAASDVKSAVTVAQSMISDVDSALTSRFSNLDSLLTTTGVALDASTLSDLRSAITAGGSASTLSDIYSLLSDLHSDVTVMSDVVSNVYSNLTRGVNVTQLNGTSLNGDGGATPWGP